MAYQIRLARRAVRDLRRIYVHIHAESSVAAQAWFLGLEAMILGLESHPRRGTVTRDRPPLRQLLYGSKPDTYRILYAVDERRKLVNVAHIRHGARRPLSPSKRT